LRTFLVNAHGDCELRVERLFRRLVLDEFNLYIGLYLAFLRAYMGHAFVFTYAPEQPLSSDVSNMRMRDEALNQQFLQQCPHLADVVD
jgi:hypothetical protein